MIKVFIYKEDNANIPFLLWFEKLTKKAQAKCRVRIERLQQCGHKLYRPESDYLRDGIYELRIGLNGINYRILYFFQGVRCAVISHGIIKEGLIPDKEIDLAIIRKKKFMADSDKHTYKEEK